MFDFFLFSGGSKTKSLIFLYVSPAENITEPTPTSICKLVQHYYLPMKYRILLFCTNFLEISGGNRLPILIQLWQLVAYTYDS